MKLFHQIMILGLQLLFIDIISILLQVEQLKMVNFRKHAGGLKGLASRTEEVGLPFAG